MFVDFYIIFLFIVLFVDEYRLQHHVCAVGGTVTEFDVGENGVLSWSPPVPPNGDILYYNVIITRADTGELVIRLEELYVLTIDVSKYGEINMDYNVKVRTHLLFVDIFAFLKTTHNYTCNGRT